MSNNQNFQDKPNFSKESQAGSEESFIEMGKKIVEESLTDAEKIYGDTVKQVTALVRKHPVEAMAIGFGVGCLVGLVLARRR